MTADTATDDQPRRTVMVFPLPLDKYDHVFVLAEALELDHRYLCLDCGRLFAVLSSRRWLHSWMTCPDAPL